MANEFKARNGVITPKVVLQGATSGSTSLVAATNATGLYTLPESLPTEDDQVLVSTVQGILSWSTAASGGAGIQGIQGPSGVQLSETYYNSYIFTGDGATTTYAVASNNLSVHTVIVSLNGVVQTPNTDYTISASNVVFSTAPALNNIVQLRILGGFQGPQGPQGLQGVQGVQGLDGLYAAQGIQGTQGVQGIQGIQGTQGVQGLDGLYAAQGIQGREGIQGRDGIQGAQGFQGLAGQFAGQGIQGTQGLQGIQGIQSTQGIQGVQGKDGLQGISGEFVAQGIQGIQGSGVNNAFLDFQTFTYTGDGTTTTFNTAAGAQLHALLVTLNGVLQRPTTDYTVNAAGAVTLTTIPATGMIVQIRILGGYVGTQGIRGIQGYQGMSGSQGMQGLSGSITYSVTNSGASNYTINGNSNPTLQLIRGFSYIFEVSATGHPFWLQTVPSPYSSGNVYNTGVTNNGTDNGRIIFHVPFNAPDTLYYACQFHGTMGGIISITNTGAQGTQGITGISFNQGLQGIQGTTPSLQTEVFTTLTGATGVVAHNYNTSGLWQHSNIVANFTANFTNVPTLDNRIHNFSLILYQGATPYYPNAVQIDGTAATILWFDGNTPTPTANKTEIASFSLVRVSGTWRVLGSFGMYG